MTPPDFQDENNLPEEPDAMDDDSIIEENESLEDSSFELESIRESHPETETLELEEVTPFQRIDHPDDFDSDSEATPIFDDLRQATLPDVEDFEDFATPTPIFDDLDDEVARELEVTDEVIPTPEDDFESLTLAELVGQFVRAPFATGQALFEVLQPDPTLTPSRRRSIPVPVPMRKESSGHSDVLSEDGLHATSATPSYAYSDINVDRRRESIKLIGYLLAFGLAIFGNWLFIRTTNTVTIRTEANQLANGMPWLIIAFFIWLGAEFYGSFPAIRAWWRKRRDKSTSDDDKLVPDTPPLYNYNFSVLTQDVSLLRIGLGWGAVMFAALTWQWTKDNQFTFEGVVTWIASIICIVLAFAPVHWNIFGLFSKLRVPKINLNFEQNWTLYAMVAIILLAGWFRFTDFSGTPPEMTSDHVEKLLDAQRVYEGQYSVFFANNGGREPFQMYAIALLTNLPFFDMSHDTLKFVANLEALLTIPLLFWMGREVIGSRDRRLGNVVGVILAGLIAVSYWHTSITRLALRIVLTPLVTSLLIIYLSRGMRDNRRADFIKAGLVLGFGLYTYQAVRMLPVVVVVGVLISIISNFRKPHWTSRYIMHLIVLVMVAFVVFVPMARYWQQSPESFWRRTSGRLLGDGIITEVDDAGNIVERNATIEERLDAFGNNMSQLAQNVRNALLMYNWKGDVAWINGAPNYPVMDIFTGALLIIGLAAWLVFMIKTRDAVFYLLPIMVFIMLLPSALSIAMPIENPSATRTSGSLPEVYLIASLPLALIAISVWRVIRNNIGVFVASVSVMLVIIGAYALNNDTYFNRFRESYLRSSLPYSEAGGIIRDFVDDNGGYGNAFIVAYEHWWDHRAVGIEAGIIDYPNGIINREEVPDFLNDAWRCIDHPYRLDPNRDLLFFYHRDDSATRDLFLSWFPDGVAIDYESYQQGDDFGVYRVPAPGVDDMVAFLETHTIEPRCTVGD